MSGEEDEGDVDKVIIEFGPDIDNIEKEIVCETEETNDIEEGSESNLFKWAEVMKRKKVVLSSPLLLDSWFFCRL